MFQLIGSILIIVTTTGLGFHKAKVLGDRSKQIRQMQSALQILEAEILYGQVPLSKACERISKQIPPPISTFFLNLSNKLLTGAGGITTIFQSSLNELQHLSELKPEEYEILNQFGETLGKHDRDSQSKQIQITLIHLNRIEQDATLHQKKYENLFRSLGVLSGLLVVIILV